jgi:hypothetical protein
MRQTDDLTDSDLLIELALWRGLISPIWLRLAYPEELGHQESPDKDEEHADIE